MQAQIETELKPRLLGMDPTDVERVWQLGFRDFWWKRGVVHTSAVSGVDQALWDIAGKAAGLPVYRMLGGKVRDRVRCYARGDLGLGSVEADAAQARDEGFDAYKHGYGAPVQPMDLAHQVDVAVDELTRIRGVFGPSSASRHSTCCSSRSPWSRARSSPTSASSWPSRARPWPPASAG